MRAKELRNLLENIPDETEILLRCQNHEHPSLGAKETIGILSVTPNLNESHKVVVFNPGRPVRLVSYMPQPTDLVSCMTCMKRRRIETCVKNNRICENCTATCECKGCGHFNIDMDDMFANKPHYEKDPNKGVK